MPKKFYNNVKSLQWCGDRYL